MHIIFVCNLIKQHIGLVHSQNKHKVPLLAHCLPIQNNLLKAATPRTIRKQKYTTPQNQT